MIDYFYFARQGTIVIRGRDLSVDSLCEILDLLRGEI
jgi:hypothetical protein